MEEFIYEYINKTNFLRYNLYFDVKSLMIVRHIIWRHICIEINSKTLSGASDAVQYKKLFWDEEIHNKKVLANRLRDVEEWRKYTQECVK